MYQSEPIARVIQPDRVRYRGWHFRSLTLAGTYCLALGVALITIGLIKGVLLLVLLGYVLVGLLIVNWYGARRNLQGLTAKRLVSGPIFVGETIEWVVEIGGTARRLNRGFRLEDSGHEHQFAWMILLLKPGQTIRVRGTVKLLTRGRYRCSPLRFWSAYPLGLVQRYRDLKLDEDVIVLPRPGILHLEKLARWLMRTHSNDNRMQSRIRLQSPVEAETHGLREFRTGDSPRWIHWRSTARLSKLMVREFEDRAAPSMTLVFEPWLSSNASPADRDRLEAGIRMAVSICQVWGRESASDMTLLIAHPNPVILSGAGFTQSIRMMEAIAAEPGDPERAPIDWFDQLGARARSRPILILTTRPDSLLPAEATAVIGRMVAIFLVGQAVDWYEEPVRETDTSRLAALGTKTT